MYVAMLGIATNCISLIKQVQQIKQDTLSEKIAQNWGKDGAADQKIGKLAGRHGKGNNSNHITNKMDGNTPSPPYMNVTPKRMTHRDALTASLNSMFGDQ